MREIDRDRAPGRSDPGERSSRDEARALEFVHRFGRDAVAFQALLSPMRHWFDAAPPDGTGGSVAYFDTGTAWVAAGGPLAPESEHAEVAHRFVAAARAVGRRACFFATERALPGFAELTVGEQPVFAPGRWLAAAAQGRRMREQFRRARAKGLGVRRVAPEELESGAPLRVEVDAVIAEWLRARPMEPMGFLGSVEPFHAPEEHRYVVATCRGQVVAFLSAVPIPARRGWLVDAMVRAADAPNGTSESLFAALCGGATDAEEITLGLAPLSGRAPAWANLAARLTRPLYDFAGLRAFRERLHPERWEPVLLVYPPGASMPHVVDVLRSLSGGALPRFAMRSLLTHPVGPPWALAMVLGAWTALLALLTVLDQGEAFGFGRPVLAGWVAFDAALAALLFRFARRPRVGALAVATTLAAVDATLSFAHLARTGLPRISWHVGLRLVATIGPVLGALALGWAAVVRTLLARHERGSSRVAARFRSSRTQPPLRDRRRRLGPHGAGRSEETIRESSR